MASSQKIEYTVMADVAKVLTDGSISNVISEHEAQPEAATFVRVVCVNLRDNLDAGIIPSGMRTATISVECCSYQHDDTDGEDLHTLVGNVRTLIYDGAIVTTLNTASTYNTYYGLMAADDLPDVEDRYRIRAIQFDLILKPSN